MLRRTPEVASFAKSVLCFQHFNIAIIYRFQVHESCGDSFLATDTAQTFEPHPVMGRYGLSMHCS